MRSRGLLCKVDKSTHRHRNRGRLKSLQFESGRLKVAADVQFRQSVSRILFIFGESDGLHKVHGM